ncbi:MAG TPA: ATP-binding cassette domain-containing protein [Candidatus Hydrogenedens sp.]|nr:ATP-binding cassette domain-containing protein [Candidatus Hydrogenedens sp.]
MIEVQKLTKFYGLFCALKDVSFSIQEGERVGLLGPNGAGKSTMMRILTGFMPASYGTAKIGKYEIHEYPLEAKQLIGYLPERVPLYDEMTVKSFLKFVAQVKGLPRKEWKSAVDEVVYTCGLEQVFNRVVGVLSKGYRQRLGLAQALIGSPPVIILDEPTVGLDPQQVVEIRELIKNLGEKHTVLLSTHILSEVSLLCSRALIMNRGEIVAEILIDPLKPSVEIEQAFLKAISKEGIG